MSIPSQSLDDIRSVGVSRAEAGSFLITGRPRIRSAWLAALLCSDDFPVHHEAPLAKTPITDAVYGLIDPGAACLYPNLALELFGERLIVIIERSEQQSRASLEALIGKSAGNWGAIEQRYQFFKAEAVRRGAIVMSYAQLEDFELVAGLVSLCTGATLTRQRFEMLLGLRVEQDFVRAQARERAAA